jgi:hypothetical protein
MCRIEPSEWQETTNLKQSEISTFISRNFLMGLKQLPNYGDDCCSSVNLRDACISKLIIVELFGWYHNSGTA